MKNNIILQHFDGVLRPLDELSIENIKQYAERFDADYELVRGKPFDSRLTSPCQKVFMIDERYDKYDDVVMLDIDMFAPKNSKSNIFLETGYGYYEETQIRLHKQIVKLFGNISSIKIPYWGGAIYKLPREMRLLFRKALNSGDTSWMLKFNKPYFFEDEGIMHVLAKKSNIPIKNAYLSAKWCQGSCFFPNIVEDGFIHIRTKITPKGPKRAKIDNYNQLVTEGIL